MKHQLLRSLLCALLLLSLLLTLASCGNAADGEEIPENMQYATLEGSPYRLFVPSDWNPMTEMGISGAYASLQSVAVAYVRDYDAAGMSAQEYAEHIHMASITSAFPEDELTLPAPVKTLLAGKSAVYVDYTGTRELVTYMGRDVLCVHGGRVYILTFCTQKDVYEQYAEVRDNITAAFLFSDTPFVPKDSVFTVNEGADAPAGMKLASNDDVAYRFYVPESWVLDRALPTSSAYASEQDRSNINVTVYMPDTDSMTAEEYWALACEQLSTVLHDMTVISTTPTTLDTRPANTYIYTATVGETLYRYAQTVAGYRGMVYTVTYTARDGQFDDHYEEYLDILAAFDFRGND